MPSYIPYESEERLQDPQQQHGSMLISFQVFDCPLSYVVSQILGLEAESLTNTELQPVPHGVGAGRVKKFREVCKSEFLRIHRCYWNVPTTIPITSALEPTHPS